MQEHTRQILPFLVLDLLAVQVQGLKRLVKGDNLGEDLTASLA